MELRVLGPVEVWRDGARVDVAGGKQRILLARLLVDGGRVVSVDALADALWGDDRPANPPAAIQVQVSNLRRALGSATIVTRSPGYVLPIDAHDVDHVRLEAYVASARTARADGRHADALDEARRAIEVAAGEPYADFTFEEWAQPEIVRLRGLVLGAHEELHAALLAVGRHHDAVPTLESLVTAHPFHERLRALLMLALYRDGRQADALRWYADGRRRLVDELGVEPGPELRQMEARILAHDDALRLPHAVAQPVAAVPATDVPTHTAPVAGAAAEELVGRASALTSLRDAWRDAARGELRIVLVEGVPGIGKSAVARWIADVAARDGATVGVSTANELAGAPPYWSWVAALRQASARGAAAALAAAVHATPGAEPVAALLDGRHADDAAVEDRRFQVFDAMARVLDHLARTAPLLLVLDDLQWADRASLDLLRFLARTATGAPMLVVAAHRPLADEDGDGDVLAGVVADIVTEPCVRRVWLTPLATPDVAVLVERLVGAPVEPALAAAIAAGTGGIPFYVEELARVLRSDDGTVDVARAAVPDSVRATVRRRASRLGEHASAVMTLASFAGGDVDHRVTAQVLGLDEAAVGHVLDRAVQAGLLVESSGRPGTYRFAHDIVRHALYDAVPQRRRAETHLAIARALVSTATPTADSRAAQIAAHFSYAVDVGGAPDAVVWLRTAAAQAARAQAYADAVRALRQALFVVRSRVVDERTECEVLIELAAAARWAADPATATLARERAHRLARRLDDEVLVARATNVLLGPGPQWLRRPR